MNSDPVSKSISPGNNTAVWTGPVPPFRFCPNVEEMDAAWQALYGTDPTDIEISGCHITARDGETPLMAAPGHKGRVRLRGYVITPIETVEWLPHGKPTLRRRIGLWLAGIDSARGVIR